MAGILSLKREMSALGGRSPRVSPKPLATTYRVDMRLPVGLALSLPRRVGSIIIIWILLLLVSTPLVQAQRLGRLEQTDTNVDSYYYYVQPGTHTIQVHVLGSLGSPGLYEISVGTDLRQLLALSGGPVLGTRQSVSRRKVIVRLFRPGEESQELFYEAELDSVAARPEVILNEGDVLTVEVIERQRFSWRDAVSVFNVVALVALAIERVR